MNSSQIEFDSHTGQFTRRRIAIPQPDDGEVVVRVRCCTICGSDLHTFCGRRAAPAGCVLGHEIIGEVEDWYADCPPTDFFGSPIRKGQRITWAMAVGCGECFFCKRGLNQKCESLFKYGHVSSLGRPTGGLSEYCVLVKGTPLFCLSDSLPDEVACPANCATATVSAAVRLCSQSHQIDGCKVLITGSGMLGLTAAAQVAELGAERIIVADLDSNRLELAHRFGATETIRTADSDKLIKNVQQLTDGRGVDIALDFAGANAAVENCIAATRIGGCVLLAGSVFPSATISISPEQIVRRMLVIRGLHNYVPQDLASALQFLERSHTKYPFADLVSSSFSLDDVQAAFDHAASQKPVRVAIRPGS